MFQRVVEQRAAWLDALNVLDGIKAKGIALHMIDLGGDVTGNGISKLVFTILSAVAEAERDRTRERVLDIIADKRKRGVHVGGQRPTGYCIAEDGTLVRNEAEQKATAGSERSRQEAAALAERMRPVMTELADLSAHQAAAELKRRKIVSATGGKWYAATVIRLRERLAL
jgi:putative DNA-invertase from lambdoid prophage Rac